MKVVDEAGAAEPRFVVIVNSFEDRERFRATVRGIEGLSEPQQQIRLPGSGVRLQNCHRGIGIVVVQEPCTETDDDRGIVRVDLVHGPVDGQGVCVPPVLEAEIGLGVEPS